MGCLYGRLFASLVGSSSKKPQQEKEEVHDVQIDCQHCQHVFLGAHLEFVISHDELGVDHDILWEYNSVSYLVSTPEGPAEEMSHHNQEITYEGEKHGTEDAVHQFHNVIPEEPE